MRNLAGDKFASADRQLTAETITNEQIRSLRAEARQVGDADMVTTCDTALRAEIDVPEAEDNDRRLDAREVCADAINAAHAMED